MRPEDQHKEAVLKRLFGCAALVAFFVMGSVGCGKTDADDDDPSPKTTSSSSASEDAVARKKVAIDLSAKGLKGTGFFPEGDPTKPSAALVPYDVKVPLWSDGAKKHRYVYVPPGKSIKPEKNGKGFRFPAKTTFVKYFVLPNKDKTPLEVRFVHKAGPKDWQYLTYIVKKDGSSKRNEYPVKIKRKGRKHRVPSNLECQMCHQSDKPVLGFEPKQLNFRTERAQPKLITNQIDYLALRGIIESKNVSKLVQTPSISKPSDSSLSLNERVRTYMDVNCSTCHRPDSKVEAYDLDLRKNAIDTRLRAEEKVVPGSPKKSILWKKVSAKKDRMPPVSLRPDPTALKLFKKFIKRWPKDPVDPDEEKNKEKEGEEKGISDLSPSLILATLTDEEINDFLKKIPPEQLSKQLESLSSEEISRMLESVSSEDMSKILDSISSEDLAAAVGDLSGEDVSQIFSKLSDEQKSDLISGIPASELSGIVQELPASDLSNLVSSLSEEDLAKMLESIPSEDLSKMVAALPPEKISDLIGGLPAEHMEKMVSGLTEEQLSQFISSLGSDEISALVAKLDSDDIGSLFSKLPEEEKAKLIEGIPEEELAAMISSVPSEKLAGIISNIPPEKMEEVAANIPPETWAAILTSIPPETVVRVLLNIPPSMVLEILKVLLPEEASDLLATLYPELIAEGLGEMSPAETAEIISSYAPDDLRQLVDGTSLDEVNSDLTSLLSTN